MSQSTEYNVFIRHFMHRHGFPPRMGAAPGEAWTPPLEARQAWDAISGNPSERKARMLGIASSERNDRKYEAYMANLMEFHLQHMAKCKEAARREKQLEFEKNKKARTIQKQWREAISNPSFKFCKNRLLNEFISMA